MSQRHVSISEAARLLHVSRRTVHRRLDAGTLRSVEVGGVRRVLLDDALDTPPGADTARVTRPDSDAQVSQLRAQVEALEAELREVRQDRDRWYGHAQAQGATIDRLTITLAQLGDNVVEQRTLAAGTDQSRRDSEAQEGTRPPWWQFWRR